MRENKAHFFLANAATVTKHKWYAVRLCTAQPCMENWIGGGNSFITVPPPDQQDLSYESQVWSMPVLVNWNPTKYY